MAPRNQINKWVEPESREVGVGDILPVQTVALKWAAIVIMIAGGPNVPFENTGIA
jgi:hypothetical protein